jgi:uncharacterized protein with ATP-grasp and redox domains
MNYHNRFMPEPIGNNVPGSWAHDTITRRLADIVRGVLAENELEPEAIASLEQLIAEIPEGEIRPLYDRTDWNHYITPFLGQNWLNVPYFFAETYFYRRILEAIGYFVDEEFDPFADRKRQGLITTREAIRQLCRQVNEALAQPSAEVLAPLLLADLWGNRADLSLFAADLAEAKTMVDGGRERLLVDETPAVLDHLLDPSGFGTHSTTITDSKPEGSERRIDFIMDNAGFELVCDLALAAYLLGSETAGTIHLHLKAHPTFVSDATKLDVAQTIPFLLSDGDSEVESLAAQLKEWWDSGRLQLHDHPFWTSPLPMWEMPEDLSDDLARSYLIIAKGDANYRRLLGDRQWPFTTPFADIVSYMPAPLLALRALKSELAAGLREEQIAWLNGEDGQWLVNGRWGVIQFQRGQHERVPTAMNENL